VKPFAMVCNTRKCNSCCIDFKPCTVQGYDKTDAENSSVGFWPCDRDPSAKGELHRNIGGEWKKVVKI
jgi:hypothetical protein